MPPKKQIAEYKDVRKIMSESFRDRKLSRLSDLARARAKLKEIPERPGKIEFEDEEERQSYLQNILEEANMKRTESESGTVDIVKNVEKQVKKRVAKRNSGGGGGKRSGGKSSGEKSVPRNEALLKAEYSEILNTSDSKVKKILDDAMKNGKSSKYYDLLKEKCLPRPRPGEVKKLKEIVDLCNKIGDMEKALIKLFDYEYAPLYFAGDYRCTNAVEHYVWSTCHKMLLYEPMEYKDFAEALKLNTKEYDIKYFTQILHHMTDDNKEVQDYIKTCYKFVICKYCFSNFFYLAPDDDKYAEIFNYEARIGDSEIVEVRDMSSFMRTTYFQQEIKNYGESKRYLGLMYKWNGRFVSSADLYKLSLFIKEHGGGEIYIRNGGNMKRVSEELNISDPNVKVEIPSNIDKTVILDLKSARPEITFPKKATIYGTEGTWEDIRVIPGIVKYSELDNFIKLISSKIKVSEKASSEIDITSSIKNEIAEFMKIFQKEHKSSLVSAKVSYISSNRDAYEFKIPKITPGTKDVLFYTLGQDRYYKIDGSYFLTLHNSGILVPVEKMKQLSALPLNKNIDKEKNYIHHASLVFCLQLK